MRALEMKRGAWCFAAVVGVLLSSACFTSKNPRYCDDETAFCDLEAENAFCDVGEGTGGSNTCVPAPDGRCARDADCAAADKFCETTSRSCVECVQDANCPRSAPICGDDIGCRSCTFEADDVACAARDATSPYCLRTGGCGECLANNQCDSGVCDVEAGECVDPDMAVYIAKTGSDGPACGLSRTTACLTFGEEGGLGGLSKVSAARPFLVIGPGNYPERVIVDTLEVRMIGEGDVVIAPIEADIEPLDAAVKVTAAAKVSLQGIELNGGLAGPDAVYGVDCQGAGTAQLSLTEVSVSSFREVALNLLGCETSVVDSEFAQGVGGGANVSGGSLRVSRSIFSDNSVGLNVSNSVVSLEDTTIRGNAGYGLSIGGAMARADIVGTTISQNGGVGFTTVGGDLTLSRSTISENLGGGISHEHAFIRLFNSVIVNNGNTNTASPSEHGGVSFTTILETVVEFAGNTVTGNLGTISSAVHCELSEPREISNSIIRVGTGEGATVAPGSYCSFAYSNVEGGADGDGNMDMAPDYVSVGPPSVFFHLLPGSAGIDVGDPDTELTNDFDGDPRPIGAAPDMGADEVLAE